MARQRLTLPPIFNQRGRMTTAITPASTAPFFLYADLSANGATDFLPPFAPN